MLKITATIALAALVTGCSTSPISFDQAKPVPDSRVMAYGQKPAGPYGTIQVSRDTGFVAGGCFVAIHVDGRPVARIDTGEAVSLFVPAGDHLVGLGADERCSGLCSFSGSLKEQSATLKAGQVKRSWIGDANVGLDIRPSSI